MKILESKQIDKAIEATGEDVDLSEIADITIVDGADPWDQAFMVEKAIELALTLGPKENIYRCASDKHIAIYYFVGIDVKFILKRIQDLNAENN